MGMGSYDLWCLSKLMREGHLRSGGAVAELGSQQLNKSFFLDQARIYEIGQLFGVRHPFPIRPGQQGEGVNLDPSDPLSRGFWEWLGFDYLAIDFNGSPQSLPLDLNYDEVPQSERKRFSVVTNFGTTEHVCNQLNCFKIVHDLCAVGGVMIHVLPMQGNFNHGLVNYNPKFFWMLARSNRYGWVYVDYHRGIGQPLPQNITDSGKQLNPEIIGRWTDYVAEDCGLVMILKKLDDFPYVAPIDVNDGTKAPNREIEERYWTVFRPDALKSSELTSRPARFFGWRKKRRARG